MINILTGDNQFLINQFIGNLSEKENLIPKTIYADEEDNLIDQIMARDLFSSRKILVVKNLFQNKIVLEQIVKYFDQIVKDDEIFLLIVEPKIDKRLKFIKTAQKAKIVHQFSALKDYDQKGAVEFMTEYCQKNNLKIDSQAALKIWQLVGNNSMLQVNAIDKLAIVSQEISLKMVEQYIEPTLNVDSFLVVDKIFAGQTEVIKQLINKMAAINVIPQMFWGLITSQIFNLAVIKNVETQNIKQFKIHPFVIKKLSKTATEIDNQQLKQILEIVAEADYKLKTISNQDWLLIKIALVKISQYFK